MPAIVVAKQSACATEGRQMKTGRILAGIALVLVLAPLASAQGRVRVGIVGGINRANIRFSGDDITADAITRSALGGVVDVALGDRLAIRMEPMYVQKGGDVGETHNPSVTGRLNTGILELPLLLKLSEGDEVKPYILAGPSLGLRLNENIEMYTGNETYTGDMTDVTEPLDFGLVFGAGVSFPLRSAAGFVECRYTLGLSNRMKGGSILVTGPAGTADMDFGADDKFKMRGLQVLVGLTLRLGGR